MRGGYNDLGIIVKTQDYGEADKIISILSQNHGLVHYFATGARRSSSKKSSHLDVFSHINYSVNTRNSQNYLTQADSLNYFSSLKKDLKKISLGFSFLEIIYNLLPAEVEDEELYLSLLNFLNALNSSTDPQKDSQLCSNFGQYLIRHLGYPPPPPNLSTNLSGYFETLMNKKIIGKEIS